MGKPTKLPSAVRDGIDPEIDRLTVELLNTTDFQRRPSATDALKVLHKVLGSSNGTSVASTPVPNEPAPPSFELGSIVDGVFRIDQELGSGSFSRVYKV